MRRAIDLLEMTDGKKYMTNDMVKLGCGDCEGCYSCCTNMGTSIILDPYDIVNLCQITNKTFHQLLEKEIELNVIDGVILPNLKLAGSDEECCFLDSNHRCSIHEYRPGLCRLFPLARLYENHTFSYVLQLKECKKEAKTKIKVKKWLGVSRVMEYEDFITSWHYFIQKLQDSASEQVGEVLQRWNVVILEQFYCTPYNQDKDFFMQFNARLLEVKKGIKFDDLDVK